MYRKTQQCIYNYLVYINNSLSIGHNYTVQQYSNFDEYLFFANSDIAPYKLNHINGNKKLLVVLLCLINREYFSLKRGVG